MERTCSHRRSLLSFTSRAGSKGDSSGMARFLARLPFILCVLLLGLGTSAQELQLVRDSIMDGYMKSGEANKLFKPTGKTDKNKLRQGKWKDYKVENDFVIFQGKDNPVRKWAHYLIYAEGTYVDGEREGRWQCYTIEDKTFKHIPYKELTYVNGVAQGPVTYSDPVGKKGFEGTYVDGRLEGEAKVFHPNGAVHISSTYANGLLSGELTASSSKGELRYVKHFVNDTLTGPYERYYPGGQLEEQFTYLAGEIHGTYHYYHPNGQLWVERTYDKGKAVSVIGSYDAQGNPRDPGTLKDGNGTVLHYDDNGKVYVIKMFKDGVEVGEEER